MTPISKDNWLLVHETLSMMAYVGEELTSFRDEKAILKSGTPPHKPSSSGRIYTTLGEYFPHVFGLKWIEIKEPIND